MLFFQIVFNKWGKTKDVGYIIREPFSETCWKKISNKQNHSPLFWPFVLLYVLLQGSEPIGQSISTMV